MSPRATVIIPSFADAFAAGSTSVDQQRLPAAQYEVLIVDDESDAARTGRLADVVAHRPNVRVVRVAPGAAPAEVVDAALAAAAGDYVIALEAHRRLTPEALATLCDHADATGADICLGLTGVAGVRPATLPEAVAVDPPELAADDPLRSADTGRVHRRASLDPKLLLAELADEPAPLPSDVRVAAVTSLTCFVDGEASGTDVPTEPAQPRHAVRATEATWSDGVLEVTALVTGAGVGKCRAGAFSRATGVEWPLADPEVVMSPDGTRVALRLDPRRVPGIGSLPGGIWWPTVWVDDEPLLIEIPPRAAHGATLRHRPVVSFASNRRLGLDVGGTTHQPIRRLRPEDCAVEENSRGSLLTARLTNIDLPESGRVEGRLRLGDLPVNAWLERDGGVPVLRAWVSGLPGSSKLAVRITRAPYSPLGARLVVDGVGGMRIRPRQQKPAAKAPTAASAPPRTVASTARRLLGRARRLGERGWRSIRR